MPSRLIRIATLLIFLLSTSTLSAETPTIAEYTVRFNATWSQGTHPVEWPAGAHWSSLIGGVHDGGVEFWSPGAFASSGIERMAETGNPNQLAGEVQGAINSGQAREVIRGGSIGRSPGQASADFTASLDHHLVTLTSMVAPSPDWFVGVHSVSLLENGNWVEQRVMPLFAYDAGTDSGASFESADGDTQPRERISLLESQSFRNNLVGYFVFTRKNSPNDMTLSLNSGRFRVDATWEDFNETRQRATPVSLTDDTGYFWFFDNENVEVVIKVLDGCVLNGHYWVFASGLTNVRVELNVVDTVSGRSFPRINPLGQPFAPIQDTFSFPCQ